jgi:hypothetical protein
MLSGVFEIIFLKKKPPKNGVLKSKKKKAK